MSIPGKPSTLIKPTLDTKFHIDYDWWERTPGEDLRVYLLSHLPHERREQLANAAEIRAIDYIDPHTGEVSPLDELHLAIRVAAEHPQFITKDISLVDSIFRVFLQNNNHPLSAHELAAITGRDAKTIVRTLGGTTIYKGIKPYLGG
ncbi:MAG: hypothetical protein MUF87_09550 [Anaerolineae bacterium]|jgi:hypothetical protein|nr:hypothetical protein [Anaerolineae bacterium]